MIDERVTMFLYYNSVFHILNSFKNDQTISLSGKK